VTLGPEMRGACPNFDGQGRPVSGIVVMRQGGDVVGLIVASKSKLSDRSGTAARSALVPLYDRSIWFQGSSATLRGRCRNHLHGVVGILAVPLATSECGDPHLQFHSLFSRWRSRSI